MGHMQQTCLSGGQIAIRVFQALMWCCIVEPFMGLSVLRQRGAE